jgi:hypothetical protein
MTATFEVYDRTGVTRVDRRTVQGGAESTVGTLVSAFELVGDGREVPGIYTVVASAVDVASPTHTATLTVTVDGGRGPYHSTVHTGVVMDATTPDYDLIPGGEFKGTASGSLANGWTSKIYVGLWVPNSFGPLRAGNPNAVTWDETDGIADPGSTSTAPGDPGAVWTVLVKNASAEAVDGCVLKRYPTGMVYQKAGPRLFVSIHPVTDAPEPDTHVGGKPRPYKFRAQGRLGGLGHVEISEHPYSSWAEFDVRNVGDGTDGTSHNIEFDDTTEYVITSGVAEGELFVLSSDADNTSIENLTVLSTSDGFEFGEGANPVAWDSEEMPISQTGRSDNVFLPSGTQLVSIRKTVAALASPDQSPWFARLYIEFSRVGEADYDI